MASASSPTIALEICVDSVASAVSAAGAGASRIELCANLYEGGTTPSIGLLRTMLKRMSIPVHVMVRPRGGDFLYSREEKDVMESDIKSIVKAGAHGIVIGVLTPEGRVDEPVLKSIVSLAAPLPVTFHRAIDVAADPVEAIRACMRCGVARVLTSGGAPSAPEGVPTLRRMVDAANGMLSIAAGGGVNEGNAAELARASGVDELHGSLRATRASAMTHRPRPPVPMGAATAMAPEGEFEIKETDPTRVAAVVSALAGVSAPTRVHGRGERGGDDDNAPLWRRMWWRTSHLAPAIRWSIWVGCFVAALRAEGGLRKCSISFRSR